MVKKLSTSQKSDVFYLKVEFSEMKNRVTKNHQGVTIFGQTLPFKKLGHVKVSVKILSSESFL